MKRKASIPQRFFKAAGLSLAVILAAVFIGCSADKPAPDPTAEPTESSVPDGPVPQVSYDGETSTLRVRGESGYDRIVIPSDADNAAQLVVEDGEFTLNAELDTFRRLGYEVPQDIPGYIDRVGSSLAFLKSYLKENAPSVYDEKFAEKTVEINIDGKNDGVKVDEDRVVLNCAAPWYRESQYLLAMMDSRSVGWEQLGYIWYVSSCIDPYSDVPLILTISEKMPYYQACIDKGVDPENITLADCRIYMDAVSRTNFDRGLRGWGSGGESKAVSMLPDCTRKRSERTDLGDDKLSIFMAASFIALLDDAKGFDTVSRFCFGKISFEEAFGTDFETAFNEWKTIRIDTYTHCN